MRAASRTRVLACLSFTTLLMGLAVTIGVRLDTWYRVWRLEWVGSWVDLQTMKSPYHRWLDYRTISSATLGVNATDDTLKLLRGAPQLESLWISDCQITDGGFQQLGRLPNLEMLMLDRVPVSDEGLQVLQGNAKLVHLELQQTRVSRKSLPMISSFGRLRFFLADHLVNDGGSLAPLATIRSLISLELSNSDVDDDDLSVLAGPSLIHLFLRDNKITGSTLHALAGCKRLEQLELTRNPLNGAHLRKLAPLMLTFLYLDGLTLPPEGMMFLQQQQALQVLTVLDVETDAKQLAALLSQMRLSELHVNDEIIKQRNWQPVTKPECLHIHLYDKVVGSDDVCRLAETDADIHLHRCHLTPGATVELTRTRHQFVLRDCPLDARSVELLGPMVVWHNSR